MRKAPFTIDGQQFNVIVPAGGLKRSFSVLDGDNAGRTQAGGIMIRDIIGTYYNYELTLEASELSPEDYDRFYTLISAPISFHTVTFPYGQSTMTFQAYVTSGSDTLEYIGDGVNYWQGITVNFISKAPQIV